MLGVPGPLLLHGWPLAPVRPGTAVAWPPGLPGVLDGAVEREPGVAAVVVPGLLPALVPGVDGPPVPIEPDGDAPPVAPAVPPVDPPLPDCAEATTTLAVSRPAVRIDNVDLPNFMRSLHVSTRCGNHKERARTLPEPYDFNPSES